jgi:hypothetical protein
MVGTRMSQIQKVLKGAGEGQEIEVNKSFNQE